MIEKEKTPEFPLFAIKDSEEAAICKPGKGYSPGN